MKTHHGKAHAWGGAGKATNKGGVLTLPAMTSPFKRELFELSVGAILPSLAERLVKRRQAEENERKARELHEKAMRYEGRAEFTQVRPPRAPLPPPAPAPP